MQNVKFGILHFFCYNAVRICFAESFYRQRPQKTQRKVIALMDEAQAQHLVTNYADMILRISYNYLNQTCDAEDICQTVFLKYLTSAPEFSCDEQEKAWIIRTTVNACKDHLKSAFFRRTAPLEEAFVMSAPDMPDTDILDALKTLPPVYRICLYLFYYEEYSAAEIAKMLKKRESAIHQYLSRGRRKLRACLTKERRTYIP